MNESGAQSSRSGGQYHKLCDYVIPFIYLLFLFMYWLGFKGYSIFPISYVINNIVFIYRQQFLWKDNLKYQHQNEIHIRLFMSVEKVISFVRLWWKANIMVILTVLHHHNIHTPYDLEGVSLRTSYEFNWKHYLNSGHKLRNYNTKKLSLLCLLKHNNAWELYIYTVSSLEMSLQ